MRLEQKHRKYAAVAVVCILLLRLLGGGVMEMIANVLTTPEAASLLLYLGTGYVIRPGAPEPTQPATEPPPETQPPAVQITPPPEGIQAVFAPEDADLVEVNSVCGYDADVEDYLTRTLSWDLKQSAPTVLIVHTHATESYVKTEDYEESSAYRTRDVGYNVVSVGDRLVQVLEMGGIHAIHDRTLHDYPSYTDSYNNSRESVAALLEKYPTVQLVLDIHRDAVEDSQGEQMKFTAKVAEKTVAQLMMVVGTDASGLTHPHWPENMSLAVKLHAQLEKNAPGICRPISFRSQRFNQDLSSGALIVEVGSAGNTRQEALLAVEILGQAILDIAEGAKPK